MRYLPKLIVAALVLFAPATASAGGYTGKLTEARVSLAFNSGNMTFATVSPQMTLFPGSPDIQTVMMQGLVTKSLLMMDITSMTCPAPLTGNCEKVNFALLYSSNIP